MRELGEPKRKVQKMEKLQEHPNPAANTVGPGGNDQNSTMEEKRERDLPRRRQDRETRGESAAQKRTRKAMRRANLEIKTKERRERKAGAAKKRKEEEDRLRRRGELMTKTFFLKKPTKDRGV